MDDLFRKVFPKNNILALREDVVEDDGSDVDVILVSPFQDFGIDSLLAEQIWSYLDGIDFMVCVKVNRVIFYISYLSYPLLPFLLGSICSNFFDNFLHSRLHLKSTFSYENYDPIQLHFF